jgi:hypothetical protein
MRALHTDDRDGEGLVRTPELAVVAGQHDVATSYSKVRTRRSSQPYRKAISWPSRKHTV